MMELITKYFWEYDSDTITSFYAHNVSMHVNGILTTYSGSIWHGEKIVCFIEDYRLATNSEVKRFHKLLNKCGKDWDGEKKQVVDWKWIPEMSNKFCFINIDGKVKVGIHDKETDNVMFNFGNCFKTREEAEVARDKIKELLNNRA